MKYAEFFILSVIVIVTVLVITFTQGTYNYIPETNHVSSVYSDAAVLYLQFVLHTLLFRPWNMLRTFYISTFRSVCIVQYGRFL
jgi:hypothetical protein